MKNIQNLLLTMCFLISLQLHAADTPRIAYSLGDEARAVLDPVPNPGRQPGNHARIPTPLVDPRKSVCAKVWLHVLGASLMVGGGCMIYISQETDNQFNGNYLGLGIGSALGGIFVTGALFAHCINNNCYRRHPLQIWPV